jgi:integrase
LSLLAQRWLGCRRRADHALVVLRGCGQHLGDIRLTRWRQRRCFSRLAHLGCKLLKPGLRQHRELVFASADGRALNAPIVRRAHYRYLRELGLPKVKAHELRHTHATHLLGQGADINLVAARLGHATPAFTLSVYGHLLPGADRAAVERLAGRFEPAPMRRPADA